MADKSEDTKKRTTKKTQTVRERTAKGSAEKPKRIRHTASKVKTPLLKARTVGRKSYHLPLPDNRAGKILKKRVRFVPKFVREAFAEIKQVTWPNRSDTLRLTMAVFIFAIIFAVIVGLLDFGLDKLFKEVIIK